MSETDRPRDRSASADDSASDDVQFADERAASARLPGDGFRLHDSGELEVGDVGFRDDDSAESGRHAQASAGFRLHDSGELEAGEVGFRDDPAEAGGRRAGFRLHDSGEGAQSDLGLVDASPDADHDDYDPRFVPPAAPPALPPRRVANKRAAEFYAAGVETHAPEPEPAPAPPVGYAVCPSCQAKNPAEADRCGRCSEALPPPIPADVRRGATAPGMGALRRAVPREVVTSPDDEHLPEHARIRIRERREASADARQASLARWHGRRRRLMVRVAGVFTLIGALPSLFFLSGGWWLAAILLDALIGAGVAKWLLDRDAHTVSGQLSFGGGMIVSTLIKGAVGATVWGVGAIVLLLACVLSLFTAVVTGGFVGHNLDQASLDEA